MSGERDRFEIAEYLLGRLERDLSTSPAALARDVGESATEAERMDHLELRANSLTRRLHELAIVVDAPVGDLRDLGIEVDPLPVLRRRGMGDARLRP